METLLAELPLDKISTSMTINATASILLALYLVVAERRGVGWDKLNGTIQNDILKEYIARGTYIYPPRGSMRIITDIFAFASQRSAELEHDFDLRAITFAKPARRPRRNLPSRLADGIAYVEAAVKAGLKVDDFASRLSFFFNVHNNFFEEIAKFRVGAATLGANHERSLQGAGRTLDDDAVPCADRRLDADGAAGRKQRRARHVAGAGGGAWRRAIAPYQLQG